MTKSPRQPGGSRSGWSGPRDPRARGGAELLSRVLLGGVLLLACGNEDLVFRRIEENRPADAGLPSDAARAADAGPTPAPCRIEGGQLRLGMDGPGCSIAGFSQGEYCGDGRLQVPEECDDGNTFEADDCSSTCQIRVCGNGRVDYGETCDRVDASCDASCQIVPPATPGVCGNGRREGAEECDDGNSQVGDGCSAVCLVEACGNARLDSGETCDPPDAIACDAQCQALRCGDGRLAAPEQCDDGNLQVGDGCDASCRSEVCGNGRLEPGEDCEPPGGAQCDAACRSPRVECGDGERQVGEECDDGNLAFGDGCSPTCLREECGNQRVELPAEECEPPGGRGCTRQCRRPRCGDGEFSPPDEECEDGNANNGDGCSADCRWEECGNGRLDPPEECEPGLTSACSPSCELEGAAELAVPVGGASFALVNPGFAGSLAGWQQLEPDPAAIEYDLLDVNGAAASGAARIRASGAATSASLLQCVRTVAGARYQVAARVRALPGAAQPVALDLGVRFHAGDNCGGRVLDGLVTSHGLNGAERDWSVALLPPAAFATSLVAPGGAASLAVWFEAVSVSGAAALLVDEVELVRVDPGCGDGIPDSGEECEPSVTGGCDDDCALPRECGDGMAAPGECSGSEACEQDCRLPGECGDGEVTAPEECDPPLAGSCGPRCTRLHEQCGDRVVAATEECDPPNGTSCGFDCRRISCGNGQVEPPETCDPPGHECTQFCRLKREQPAVCGDRWLQGAEECDPPNPSTWCTSLCLRRNPDEACGDGRVDADLGEQCEPPGFAGNCGLDCRTPVCGDSRVSGAEQCEPGRSVPESCGSDCRFLSDAARECVACLAISCASSEPAPGAGLQAAREPFAACFELEGVAQAGPAEGVPLRELCAEAVECMRQTGCEAEFGFFADPLACYCGKGVVVDASIPDQAGEIERTRSALRACHDGTNPPHGACREAFQRAAEASGPGLAVAAFDREFGRPAVLAALRLMNECGRASACGDACGVTPSCGDGVVGSGERCDPADPAWGTKCSPLCTLLPCGNGRLDEGETCDVADPYTNVNGSCSPTCQLRTDCGDGRLTVSVEACDPGPNGSWAECCRPTQDGPPGDPAHLEGCDRDDSGTISEVEGCQVPSVCGNGAVEGLEQCDPPEAGKCDAECREIDDSPCARCALENCSPQREACFEGDPSVVAGCAEVVNCVERTGCISDNGDLLPCLCGDTRGPDCVSGEQLPGACAAEFTENTSAALCSTPTPACVYQNQANETHSAGKAYQWFDCRLAFCFAECADRLL